jgi:hypothetical protein
MPRQGLVMVEIRKISMSLQVSIFDTVKRTKTQLPLNAFFALLFFFSACNNSVDTTKTSNFYFSLKDYFNTEAARLKQENVLVKKTVILNDKAETKNLKIEDWNNELLTFSDADINKSAFVGKYSIDSVFKEGKLTSVSYIANENKLKTKSITLHFSDTESTPTSIDISLETKNTLYHSTQQLHYESKVGYSVMGTQEIRVLKKDEFQVKVSF